MTTDRSQTRIADLVGGRVRGPAGVCARAAGGDRPSACRYPSSRSSRRTPTRTPTVPRRRALEALRDYDQYHRYPDPISRRLAQRIAEYVGVPAEHILVGNGSDELIDLILRLFRPGPRAGESREVIDCQPTFGMYAFYGATNDMRTCWKSPAVPTIAVDIDGIEALCNRDPRPRVLFVASPNNPDGQLLPTETLERLLDLPLLVVLDEAYVEFCGRSSRAPWVPARQNLIVLRTFSKWAGLAGLRVGYGVFPPDLMPSLWRLKSPYNVNGPAQAAALATLENVDQAMANVRRIASDRDAAV